MTDMTQDASASSASKEELEEDRTEWAHQRTLLAKERTFSAWVRTGLATIVAGFAVVRLLIDAEPPWMVTALGVLFTVMGGVILAVGYWSYRKTLRKLTRTDVRAVPGWLVGLITLALLAGAAGGLWLIL